MTDITKITIAAIDEATEVIRNVQSSVEKLHATYAKFAAVITGGLGAGYFVHLINEATEAAAQLENLAKSTGTSVEGLSQLKAAAALSGTAFEQVVVGLERMAKQMSDASLGGGKAEIAFRAMGLSVRDSGGQLKSTESFILEFAEKLSQMENQTQRVAYAQAAFGRGGAALIPFLLALVENGQRNASVTADQAAKAEQYEVTLRKLHATTMAFFNMISQQVTPVFDAFARTLLQVRTETGSLNDTTAKLAADNSIRRWAIDGAIAVTMLIDALRGLWAGAQLAWDGIKALGIAAVTVFDIIGNAAWTSVQSMQNLGEMMMGVSLIMNGQFQMGAQMIAGAFKGLKAEWSDFFTEAKRSIDAAGAAFSDFKDKSDNLRRSWEEGSWTEKFIANLDKTLEASKRATGGLVELGNGHDIVRDAITKLIEKLVIGNATLQTEIDFMHTYGIEMKAVAEAQMVARLSEQSFIELLEKHAKATGESVDSIKARLLALAREADVLTQVKQVEKDYLTQVKQLEKDYVDWLAKKSDNIQKLRDEANAYGMTAAATTQYKIAKLEALKALAQETEGAEDAVRAYQGMIDKLNEVAEAQANLDAVRNQVNAWKDIAQMGAQFFEDLALHGKTAIQALRDLFKKLLQEMIAIFAQRWILQLGAAATGSTALSSAAGTVGQGTANSLLGSALGGANEWGGSLIGSSTFTGGVSSAIFGTGSLTGAGDFVGTGLAGMAGNLALAAGATDAFAATIAAAVPVIGWIVAIGAILYSLYGASSGGPKQQGAFFGSFGTAGELVGPGNPDITGITGDNQQAGTAQQVSQAVENGYVAAMRALGLTPQALAIGVGFSSDPSGTAPSFVHTIVKDALGNVIAQIFNDQVGRDPQAMNAELQRQSAAAILAALQATDMPAALHNIIKDIDPATASLQQLDAALQQLLTTKAVIDALAQLNLRGLDITALTAWQQGSETLTQTLQRVVTQISQFDNAFMTDAQKLDHARAVIAQTFSDLGIAIPSSNQEFYNLVHSLDLSTEAGRHAFDMLMAVAPAFQAVGAAADQAAQAAQAAAAQMLASFDAVMGQLRPGYTAGQTQLALDSAVSQFMANNPWTQGHDPQWVIDQLLTIQRDDFQHYDAANQQLILAILDAVKQLQGTVSSTAAVVSAVTGGVNWTGYNSNGWQPPGNTGGTGTGVVTPPPYFNPLTGGPHDVWTIGDQAANQQALNTATSEEARLQLALLQTMGDTNAQRAIELERLRQIAIAAGLDSERLVNIQKQIYAYQDEAVAAKVLTDEMVKTTQAMDQVASFAKSLQQSIFSIQSSQSGFDAISYWQGQIATLTAQLRDVVTPDNVQAQLQTAGELQQAIMNRYQAELAAIQNARNAENAAGQAAVQAANQLNAAYRAIGNYATSLLTSSESPLSPDQQLAAAKGELDRVMGLARGGDVTAAGQVQNAAQTFLNLNRQFYGTTGAGVANFTSVQQALAQLGAMAGPEQVWREDTAKWESAILEVQNRALNDLHDLARRTVSWQTMLQDLLHEQATQLVNLVQLNRGLLDEAKKQNAQIAAAITEAQETNAEAKDIIAQVKQGTAMTRDAAAASAGEIVTAIEQQTAALQGAVAAANSVARR